MGDIQYDDPEGKALLSSSLIEKEELYDDVDVPVEERSERRSRLSFSSSFSAVHPSNSAYLTCFLLLNTMIGSGILNQPYVFRASGIIGGIIMFIIATIFTWLGLLCLTAAGIHVNVLEYAQLAERAFEGWGEMMVDIGIIVFTFGAQLGYILVVGTLLSGLLASWDCGIFICNDFFVTIISVGVFVAPVCMFRHFGHLAYLSLFSIATIVSVLLLVMIAGPIKHVTDHRSNNYEIFNITGMLTSTGSIIFSLACASANFQAYITTERKSRNMTSWSQITGAAVIIGAIMCSTMGIAGYLSFGDNTEGEILDDFPQHGYDFFKVMVVTHLILYIPVNFVIMRYSIIKVFMRTRSELLPFITHTVITLVLLTGVTAMVLLLLGLGLASGVAFTLILNITGGIGGSMVTLILPASIYLRIMPKESDMTRYAWALLIFGFLVMITVLTFTILSLSSGGEE